MASEIKEESNSASSDVKNEESSEETKKVDNEVKDDKDSVKSENKEDDKKDASEDDEEEESEDEEVALLDRPVEVTGCRARKKVERLDVSFSAPKDKQEIPEGKGKKLGDCPRIEAQIQKMKVLDLKPMHKILFNRTGSANEIKRNIRKFSGFPFDKDSQEFTRKKASVEKLTTSILKQVCLTLDIERSGTKEDIVNRLLTFLLNPEDSGKKVPASKKKTSKDKKKSSEKKKVKSEKKGKSSKDSKESDGDAEESADDDDDDDSTGGEASMGGTDEEAEALLTEPKKKSKETKKPKPKAEKAKKEDKKQKATKRKRDDDEEDDDEDKKSSESSDDEPVAKKSKMPSDEEISKLVKKILESADLQEITMKKVIKQVSDTYPDFDLSHKKAFIKSTIKSIL